MRESMSEACFLRAFFSWVQFALSQTRILQIMDGLMLIQFKSLQQPLKLLSADDDYIVFFPGPVEPSCFDPFICEDKS